MYIGIDIGGTFIKFGVIDEVGKIIEKSSIPTKHDKEKLIFDITNLINQYKKKYPLILGIGVSAPGIITKEGEFVTAGSIRPLYGVNLKKEIELRCNVPTNIENDANAAAIAEQWIGNAKEIENYICLVLGTGIGGGIIINNDLFQGTHGMAGEFGWMLIRSYPLEGNLESASWNQRASVVGGLCYQYELAQKKMGTYKKTINDAREIIRKSETGDLIAKEVLKKFYQDLSVGIINLISSFDPEVILIGGGISENSDFMSNLNNSVDASIGRHESLSYIKNKGIARIIPTKLKNDAGMIGAVYQIHKNSKRNSF